MSRGLFVTGTDTGVGKTFVACALARRVRQNGQKVFAFKPIETGFPDRKPGEGDDQAALCEAAGGWQAGTLRGLYLFGQPVAPLVAAEAERAEIDLERVRRTVQEGAGWADWTIVEGAGGWRVPITGTADMSTLARVLDLPVVVVARATLGTINHTLLTVEAVERDGARVAAVVLSRQPAEDPAFAASNAAEIGRRWKGRVLVFDGRLEQLDVCFT